MIKKFSLAMIMVLFLTPLSMAEYPSDVVILDKPTITKLTDEQLTDTYVNTLVEIAAIHSFHTTSGYSPKEYKDFKALLKFQIYLYMELKSRNLDVPTPPLPAN